MSAPHGITAAAAATTAAGGGRPTVEDAFLVLREPPVNKTSLQPGAEIGRIPFQFKPKDLTLSKTAKWGRDAQKGGKKSAVPQYLGPEPSKLALEMFLDASARQDAFVVKAVEQLFGCCVPTTESHDKSKGSPPLVIFHWGSITSFTGYIKSVSAKYTLFTPAGVPIRAVVSVNIEELAAEPGAQNPTSGAMAARKVHTIVAGDTLASIAYREYGDPTVWRTIAMANAIDDPARLRIGTTLLLPSSDDLVP